MLKTNIVLDTINNRRSIREYLDKPVTDEVLSQILEAGFRAPFAAQLCSVIYTRSREKMKEAGIGVYPTPPVHMIFFIDLVRLEKIMTHRGHEYGYDDMMAIWLGMQDVVLMIENLIRLDLTDAYNVWPFEPAIYPARDATLMIRP